MFDVPIKNGFYICSVKCQNMSWERYRAYDRCGRIVSDRSREPTTLVPEHSYNSALCEIRIPAPGILKGIIEIKTSTHSINYCLRNTICSLMFRKLESRVDNLLWTYTVLIYLALSLIRKIKFIADLVCYKALSTRNKLATFEIIIYTLQFS